MYVDSHYISLWQHTAGIEQGLASFFGQMVNMILQITNFLSWLKSAIVSWKQDRQHTSECLCVPMKLYVQKQVFQVSIVPSTASQSPSEPTFNMTPSQCLPDSQRWRGNTLQKQHFAKFDKHIMSWTCHYHFSSICEQVYHNREAGPKTNS